MTHHLSKLEILELRADLDDVLRVKQSLQNSPQASAYQESFLNELNRLKAELDQLAMVAY